jgi:hypothetical protein
MMIAGFEIPDNREILIDDEPVMFKPAYQRAIELAFLRDRVQDVTGSIAASGGICHEEPDVRERAQRYFEPLLEEDAYIEILGR